MKKSYKQLVNELPTDGFLRIVSDEELLENELSEKYSLNAPNYSENPLTRFPKILIKGTVLETLDTVDDSRNQIYIDIFICDTICRYKRSTGLVGIPTGRKHYAGEILPSDTFFPVKTATFENFEFFIPGNYDRYLTNLYGDYMQMPPVEKREKHGIVSLKFLDQ